MQPWVARSRHRSFLNSECAAILHVHMHVVIAAIVLPFRSLLSCDVCPSRVTDFVDTILERILLEPEHPSQPEKERKVPLALRLSGSLMLGTVKIYCKQVTYLQEDCERAIRRLNQARSGCKSFKHCVLLHEAIGSTTARLVAR
jgi:hypothetical protein